MSIRFILRSFVNERLTAAAEEIFQVFDGTIAKYEEEATSSKQEIERLRGLLLESVSHHKTGSSQTSPCKEETLTEQHDSNPELSLSVHHPHQHIKEEYQERLVDQRQEEEEDEDQVEEFKHADIKSLPHASTWEEEEPGDTKSPFQPQTGNGEVELQHPKEMLPLASGLSSQEGRENKIPAVSLSSNQSHSSFIASGESTELFHLNLVEYRCQLCDKSFSSNNYLINHAFHQHARGVICALCGETLESTQSLEVHLKSHRSKKRCQMCGKCFTSATALTEHMVSHAGVKLHRCHVCGKECSRKGDLKIHMRIHTGEKPFSCSFCSRSFTHSGHLKKHMRSHTGERPHRCELCGRGFLQSVHLKYHLSTHAQSH